MPTFPLTDDTGADWLVSMDEATNTITSIAPVAPAPPPPPPPPSGTVLAYSQAATGRQKTFSLDWVDVPEQQLVDVLSGDWLVLARNRVNRDETRVGMRVVPFAESQLDCNVMSSDNSITYGFFKKWTADGSPITKQFRIEAPPYRVRAETNRLAALQLDLLTEGVDYWAAEDWNQFPLANMWALGATAVVDVAEAGPHMILGCDWIRTTLGGVDLMSRIKVDGAEVVRWKQESRPDDYRRPVLLWWEDLQPGQHVIELQTTAAVAAHERQHSALFVLRLGAFAAYAVDKNIPEVDLGVGIQGEPEAEYPTTLNSVTLNLPSDAPVMVMSGTVEDGTQLGRNRIEVDGAGVIADSEGTCMRWDGDDEQPNWLFHVEEMLAGPHLIEQTAGDTPPNPSTNKCEDSVLVAFSLELAG